MTSLNYISVVRRRMNLLHLIHLIFDECRKLLLISLLLKRKCYSCYKNSWRWKFVFFWFLTAVLMSVKNISELRCLRVALQKCVWILMSDGVLEICLSDVWWWRRKMFRVLMLLTVVFWVLMFDGVFELRLYWYLDGIWFTIEFFFLSKETFCSDFHTTIQYTILKHKMLY